MKILITGGAGFQGSHLTETLLKAGHEVSILNTYSEQSLVNIESFKDNPKLHIIWGSITDKEIVKKTVRGQDVVYHLAARINVDESIADPSSYLDVNIYGTYNVLEAVKEQNCRLIYASTCEVYGAPVHDALINEETELRPHSPYAASKASADRLCFAYYKTYGVDVTIVRPFNIFGPRQKAGKGGALIAILVENALNKQPLQIFGSGEQTRDYLFVGDLVNCYSLVLAHPELKGEVINFGTGAETKIKDIAEYIGKKLNVEVKYIQSRPGEVARFAADITKAKKFGFQPTVDIWQGIDRYIEWRTKQ